MATVSSVPIAASITAPTSVRSRHLALVAMLFAVAMTFIDQTIVAIAAPSIQTHLGLSIPGTRWVVNGYLLGLAATFALGGRLADVIGSRRMVIIGIVGFAGSSAMCGLTPSGSVALSWIVTFRVLQGICGALMIPAATSVVVAAYPVHERGRALAIFFTVSGALTAVGPIAGGYLTHWTWRAIFWINVPIAVLAIVLTAAARLPHTARRQRIDIRGAVLVCAGMALSVLGFEQAQVWTWHSPGPWACVGGGAVLLAVFAAVEVQVQVPLIRVRIFRDRAFVIDNLVLFFAMIAFVPVFFFASVYSQVSLGYNANRAGLYLLLIFAGFAPAAQVGGRMLDRRGARHPMVLGSALACTGFALWAGHIHELSLSAQWPYIVISGAGIGLLLGPASTDAVNHAVSASYGEATGITQTVRNYASALGIAILGTISATVFANRLTNSLVGVGVPSASATGIANEASRSSSTSLAAAPAQLRRHVAALVAHDYATATEAVLIGMAVALGIALWWALHYPRIAPAPKQQT
jgi:EmrB/QacA subfamily drug resistance transporter